MAFVIFVGHAMCFDGPRPAWQADRKGTSSQNHEEGRRPPSFVFLTAGSLARLRRFVEAYLRPSVLKIKIWIHPYTVSPGTSSSTCIPLGSTSSRSCVGVPVSSANVP